MQCNHFSSHIFPSVKPIPEIIGSALSRQEVLQQINSNPDAFANFKRLSISDQNALLDFCMGNRSLQITYDPFFPGNLSSLKASHETGAISIGTIRTTCYYTRCFASGRNTAF